MSRISKLLDPESTSAGAQGSGGARMQGGWYVVCGCFWDDKYVPKLGYVMVTPVCKYTKTHIIVPFHGEIYGL